MAGPPASVAGVPEAQAAYQGIADDARNMTEAHRLIASAGEAAARSRAPTGRTGQLAGSIKGSATERDATLTISVPYWPYQEFGTRYVTARRFGRAGIDAMTQTAPDAYRARMASIIDSRT
jgi:hypothetical protein